MKRIILVLSIFIAARSWGQTAAQNINTPFANARSLNLLTSQLGLGTNFAAVNLPAMLVALQNNLDQILPVLAAFNDAFDFTAANAANTGGTSVQPGPTGVTANFGTSLATNLGQNFGANLGTSFGTTVGTPTTAMVPSTTPPLVTNGLALTPPGVGLGFNGSVTNNAGVANSPRDTLRALVILQDDLQRLLPLLSALNSGATNAPASSVLTPTGR